VNRPDDVLTAGTGALRHTELHSSVSSVPVLRSIAITARKKALIK